MKSHRKYSYLDTQSNYHQDQKQVRIPKFSIEQSNCKRNPYLLEKKIDEQSWLERYAKENYKMSNSTLFDQQQPQIQKQVDEMKFSFSQNFTDQILTENKQKRNRQAQNNFENKKLDSLHQNNKTNKQSIKDKRSKAAKQNLVGSIKRNRNYENTSQNKNLTSTFHDEVEICEMQKLQQMQIKLRKMFNPKLSIISSDYLKDCVSKPQANQFNNKARSQQNQQSEQNKLDWMKGCLRCLFQHLDKDKIGVLSHKNCCIGGLKEEIKLMFGTIISRIKLKNQQFTLRQFQREGEIIMQPFNQSQYQWIFEDFKQKGSTSLKKQQETKSKQLTSLFNQSINPHNLSQKKMQPSLVQQISKRPYINLQQTRFECQDSSELKENKRLVKSKSVRISNQVITEHKKNLEDLDRLNSIMQTYLGSQKKSIFSDFSSGYGKRQGRLKFEQLIKHI